jgi:hypothetical protein
LEPTYDYGEDDEWDEDAENWTAEDEASATEVIADVKDESTAYLEFLNEEVSFSLVSVWKEVITHTRRRRKSSAGSQTSWMRMSLVRRRSFWTRLSTSLSHMDSSRAPF